MRVLRILLCACLVCGAGCPGEDAPPAVDQAVTGDVAPQADGLGDAVADAAQEGGAPDAAPCGGKSCDDKLSCTDDMCLAGACVNKLRSGHCLVGGVCYKDGDKDPATSCHKCSPAAAGKAWTDDPSLCQDDGLSCTKASCSAGLCTHDLLKGNCKVGGICIKDGAANPKNSCRRCDTTKSINSYQNAKEGASCASDGVTCTTGTCKAGSCDQTINSGYCLINNTCYLKGELNALGACQRCDPAKSTSGWSQQADGSSCKDDGISCTTDTCSAGLCLHKVAAGCLIKGKCYKKGAANPASGCQTCDPTKSTTAWTANKNGTACAADKYACTADVCQAGACTHALSSGYCLISGKCYAKGTKQAGKTCSGCEPAKSTSAWTTLADGASCTADSYSCTADQCKAGVCTHTIKASSCLISGKCYTTGAQHPTAACKSCNPSKASQAWTTQPDGSSCAPDAYSCTRDVCQAGACTHSLKPANCLIGGSCYGNGAFNPKNGCQSCNANLSTSSWTALVSGSPCKPDTHACTRDICSGGSCTHPLKAGFCFIGGACYAAGDKHPGGSCLTCNPSASTASWSMAANGTACASDGKNCTSDVCVSGSCSHSLLSGYCLIGNTCYGNGAKHPLLGCQVCNSAMSTSSWSTLPNGSACTSGGPYCTNSQCNGGSCVSTPKAGYCFIGGSCYSYGQSPGSSCAFCKPSASSTSWSYYSYAGCCDGSVVKYCENGVLKMLDCSLNPACGWDYLSNFYNCGTYGYSDPSGINPKGC